MRTDKIGATLATRRRRSSPSFLLDHRARYCRLRGCRPVVGNNVELRESLLLAAVYITLASNLNIMLGYAGYINFGSIVFFGLGGYICVYLISAPRLAAGARPSLRPALS